MPDPNRDVRGVPYSPLSAAPSGQGYVGVTRPRPEGRVARNTYQINQIRRRLLNTEAKLAQPESDRTPFQIVTSLSGGLSVSHSPDGLTWRDCNAFHYHIHLDVAGTTTTTVQLRINEDVVLSRDLVSGVTDVGDDIIAAFDAYTTTFRWEISAIGSGASDLTCILAFR